MFVFVYFFMYTKRTKKVFYMYSVYALFLCIKYVYIVLKSAFGCFKGFFVHFSCIWLFVRVDLAFFYCNYLATLFPTRRHACVGALGLV